MNIEKVAVEKLQAAAYNPRKELKPGDAEYEKLREMMEPLYEKYCGDYMDLITSIRNG